MRLFVWLEFPIDYFHVGIVVLAESLDQAIEAAMQRGKAEGSNLFSTDGGATALTESQIEQWLRENVQDYPVDQPVAAWSEHWA